MADEFERLRNALAGVYDLERELGRGGAATVYLAEDVRHHRPVAVKMLKSELSSTLAAERFKQEISICARLQHPHIVPLLDSGEADGLFYYVMPLVEGESLRDLLKREGALPPERAQRIALETLSALEYAHRRNVIHRDVKPGNILLTAGHAVIADFGIARAIEMAADRTLTETGVIVGTPTYMSPEQLTLEAEVDGRADIYSLGCVLYEMLAGTPPFTARSLPALMVSHLTGEVPALSTVAEDVPPPLANAVERSLAKDPDDRFATASEFMAAFDPSTGGRSRRRQWGSGSKGARFRWIAATVGALAFLAIGVVGVSRIRPVLDSGAVTVPDGTVTAPEGLPGTVVVLPFETPTSGAAEDSVASVLAEELTRQLNGWASVLAIPRVSLSGPMFDLGLSGLTLERLEDGIALAGAVGADALITMSVALRGDSAFVTANRFEVASGRMVGRPVQSGGGSSPIPLRSSLP